MVFASTISIPRNFPSLLANISSCKHIFIMHVSKVKIIFLRFGEIGAPDPVHFLSTWLSDIVAITKSSGDKKSP